MSERIRASVAETYPEATTHGKHGSIGLGHVVKGRLHVYGGDGWYVPAPARFYDEDDGAGYRAAVS